jgi:cytochrome o ubiquinol oxidase subunit II
MLSRIKMSNKHKIVISSICLLVLVVVSGIFFTSHNVAVLNPKGTIAKQELDLIITSTILMMLVVVPVLVMTFVIAWKYRVGNKTARYSPDWDHNNLVEITWWVIPTVIILMLSVMTWNSSHSLDPFKPLSAKANPLKIQAIALQWRWLFIYPDLDIATVNYIQFPKNTPIDFEITSDAPMNSLWIPQLGGQIYAMAGMSTKLHLMADQLGSFDGSSANLSGQGFAGMKFVARSSTQAQYDSWLQQVRNSSKILNSVTYTQLAKPSTDTSVGYFSRVSFGLYNDVLGKYMQPGYNLPLSVRTNKVGASL